jgi:hypothetical protein
MDLAREIVGTFLIWALLLITITTMVVYAPNAVIWIGVLTALYAVLHRL